MSSDRISYLNQNDNSPLFSKLRQTLRDAKQGRASVGQWTAMLSAFTQKGVKKLELEEGGILEWLATQDASSVITKDDLLAKMLSLTVTIKEVVLGTPLFPSYRQPGGKYREVLYIANSERDNVDDELETVEYEMEELSFHLDRLEADPDLLTRLEARRTGLIDYKPQAIDFERHHYSDVVNGKLGRNLVAHCRAMEYDDTYFIQEIQSDWAQKGRKNDWQSIPKGPLVTNTEAWSGMVLRRHLQLAAQNPAVKRVAWITETMKNGGTQNVESERQDEERAKARQAAITAEAAKILETMGASEMNGEQLETLRAMARTQGELAADRAGLYGKEGMNSFYLKVLPKLAEKAVQGTNERVTLQTIDLGNSRPPVVVPTLEMTDAVRARLIQAQPLYSRAPLLKVARSEADPAVTALVKRCGDMIGSSKHLRLVARLYDKASGKPVAGTFEDDLILVALNSKDIDEVVDHETFHFAQKHLLTGRENRMLLNEFAYGGELHIKVQEILVKRRDYELAIQCHDPQEAAAQGFALWRKGLLDVAPKPVKGLFSDIVSAVKDVVRWLRSEVLEQKLQTSEDVFKSLAAGDLAHRQEEEEAEYERLRVC